MVGISCLLAIHTFRRATHDREKQPKVPQVLFEDILTFSSDLSNKRSFMKKG